MRAAFLLAALALAGCTDDGDCINGSCKGDPDETRAFPGPCTAATEGYDHDCTFMYDAAGHLTHAACKRYGGLEDELVDESADYVYDASGKVDAISQNDRGTLVLWSWFQTKIEAIVPSSTLVARYDRALFAFDPGTPIDRASPRASLGLLQDAVGTYTWSRAGNTLTRASSTGATVTYQLDDAGRLIGVDGAILYSYDGDRLATGYLGAVPLAYHYDRGGNLIEVTGPTPDPRTADPVHEVFDYSCWQ